MVSIGARHEVNRQAIDTSSKDDEESGDAAGDGNDVEEVGKVNERR